MFTLQLYEFAGFRMQCNSMFVIVSYSGTFWIVVHSSPINLKGGHVFHRIQNTVCLLKTTVHSMYMYLPEDVVLYGKQEEGTDIIKSTFLEPALKTPALSYYRQQFCPNRRLIHFFSIILLYVFKIWTTTMDTFL